MDEILKRDQNHVTVLAGVTDDASELITMLRVDPVSKRLLVKSTGGGGTALTVQDIDGTPTVTNVNTIKFTNGSVTDDGSGVVTVTTGSGGGGDVNGPASSTDNAVARFDSTSGKIIQNSAVTIADTTGDITAGKYNTVAISGTSTPTLSVTGTTSVSGTNTGNQTITLTGDVTGSGTGSFAATLATVNSNVGSFTNASLTVNGKGLITAASNGTAPVTSVSVTAPITSTGGTTPTLSTSMATNKLIGRGTAGTGVFEEITLGTNLSLSGTTLNATGGGSSPLTTKGDVYTYTTVDARLPVGTNGQVLSADSAEATGLKWITASGTGDVVGPSSSTDNSIARFDSTTGKLIQNSAIQVSDVTTYSSKAYIQEKYDDGSTSNIATIITPKGTGAFIWGAAPDGSTGGNNRGSYAVDFGRAGTTYVASGDYAVNFGLNNTASGTYSLTQGFFVTASGPGSASFGYICTSTGGQSFSSGAYANATAYGSAAFGTTVNANGQASFVAGENCTASVEASSSFGNQALSNKYSQQSHASGFFSTQGDAQYSRIIARNTTTNATQTNLFLDGSSARLTIPNNTTWVFNITISARRATAGDQSAGYTLTGVIDKGTTAGSTALVGTVTKTVIAEDDAAWDVDATADATNGALNILVTGVAATNIRWVAVVDLTEVTYA